MSFSSSTSIRIPQELYIPLVDEAVFDNIHIDSHSLDLVEKGSPEQRYAVVGFIDEEDKELHLYFRPSFIIVADEDEEQKKIRIKGQKDREKFNLEDIVEAPSDVTGVVHHNTIASIRAYFKAREIYIPHLKSNKIIGLSFRKKSKNILSWLSRSTLNYSVFDTNPVASVCFHFPAHQSNFDRPQYLGIYHLQRTLKMITFNKIRDVVKNSLLKKHELKEIPNEEKDQENELKTEESNKQFGMKEWLEIRGSKEKIAEYMMRTIYFASGLLPTDYIHVPYQPDNAELIQNILKIAIEYDIPLHLNDIPLNRISKDKSTAFFHACKIGDLEAANLLLNHEAKQKKDSIPSSIDELKCKNNVLAEALFKYCCRDKIKVDVIKDTINIMKENIQGIDPLANEKVKEESLSKIIHSYSLPKDSRTLLQVIIDLDHYGAAHLLAMYFSNDILNNALFYSIKRKKIEFIHLLLEKNICVFSHQEILLQAALTGRVDIIQLIKKNDAKLLEDTAITKFNRNLQKGMLSMAGAGEYLKVKQLQDEFKIDLNEKYLDDDDDNYTLDDKLFEIFLDHIRNHDNLKAVTELKNHMYETFISNMNRKQYHGVNCDKTFVLDYAIQCGAINVLQFSFPYYEKMGQKEKEQMTHDCLVSRVVRFAYNENFNEILDILNKNPDISVKSINFKKESIACVLFLHFHTLLYKSDLESLKKISSYFPNLYQEFLNANSIDGNTMTIAISHSSKEVITFLLKNNHINLEVVDEKGNTLLLNAAAKTLWNFPIVELLLEKGANKEAVNHAGFCINDFLTDNLIYCAEGNATCYIKPILDTCKKFNINIEFDKLSKISGKKIKDCFIKLFFQHVKIGCRYSLSEDERSAPEIFNQFLNGQNNEGNSPIMISASQRDKKTFDFLIDKKIDLELKNSRGETALLIAASHGNLAFVGKLLEKKANQNIKNFAGLGFKECLVHRIKEELFLNVNFISEIKEFEKKYPGIIDYTLLLNKSLSEIDIKTLSFIMDHIKIDSPKTISELNNVLIYSITHKKLDIALFLINHDVTLMNTTDKILKFNFNRCKDLSVFMEDDDKSERFHSLEMIYELEPIKYKTTLNSFSKIDQLVQQLNSIPDCKAIKEITKNIYSTFIEQMDKPEEVFNTLLKDVCKLSEKLKATLFYRSVCRLYTANQNRSINEKLDNIIKKFSTDVVRGRRYRT